MTKHKNTTPRKTRIKASILLILALSFISHLSSLILPTAYAEGVSLKVAPSVLQIQALTPSEVSAPFSIQNQSNQSIKLKIGYKVFNPTNSQQGTVSFITQGDGIPGADKQIFEKMQVLDNTNTALDTLDLGPKQQKDLQLHITLPANEPASDYYFSLVFLHDIAPALDQTIQKPDKKAQKSITTLQTGIGINVLLAVGPAQTPQGYIEEFTTPWYRESGPVPFTIKIRNTGNHFINPKGFISIKNVFGQTVGRVDIPATPILADTTRSLTDIEQIISKSSIESHAFWKEKFLLGFYNATVNITLSNDNATNYTQTTRFFAFPPLLIIVFILFVIYVFYLFMRIKRRIRKHRRIFR